MLEIPDHLYRISIIGGSESGNSDALLYLIDHDSDVDKTFYILKIHMKKILINNLLKKSTSLKYLDDSKALLNNQTILIVFMKILKNTIQIISEKF